MRNWCGNAGQGPAQAVFVLVSHEHFGIDLAPGLSVKMNAAFVSDVLGDRRMKTAISK
jgi:hypothetical protein